MGVHIPWMGTSFPILAPRTRTDSPSTAMCIFFGRAVSSALSFLFSSTSALYAGVPMGMTSVFAALNLALEAEHHISRICWRVAKLSVSRRYTVVSSANIAVTTRSIVLLTLYPARSEARSMVARGSMAMMNRRQDSGLPCALLVIRKQLLRTPFMTTWVSGLTIGGLHGVYVFIWNLAIPHCFPQVPM